VLSRLIPSRLVNSGDIHPSKRRAHSMLPNRGFLHIFFAVLGMTWKFGYFIFRTP
ncbi:hypothetical protein L9F63_005630, partial [Diploptera punctata]